MSAVVRILLRTALLVCVPVLAFFAGVRTAAHVDRTEAGARTLIAWEPSAPLLPICGAVVAWTVMLAWSRRGTDRDRPSTSNVLAVLLAAGFAWMGGQFRLFERWSVGDPVIAADGRTYRAGSGFRRNAIALEEGRSWDRTTMKIVAEAGTDWPRRYAIVVAPRSRSPGALLAADDGLLVLTNEPHCYVAYDVRTATPLVRDELAVVSPFAALRPDEDGSAEHLGELEQAVIEARANGREDGDTVIPSDEVMLRALESRNQWVREAASRIVVAGGTKLFPRAGAAR